MTLPPLPGPYQIPSYSLTGDLLAFQRCGLRYRFHGIGKLPETRPIQRWYGVFVHACLDEAHRFYEEFKAGSQTLPPWHRDKVTEITQLVSERLDAQGLQAGSRAVEDSAFKRVERVLHEAGPSLLPLIIRTETRVTATRPLPPNPPTRSFRVVDRYEVAGVIDAVAELDPADSGPVAQAMRSTLELGMGNGATIVIDYKGMRRPTGLRPSATETRLNPMASPGSALDSSSAKTWPGMAETPANHDDPDPDARLMDEDRPTDWTIPEWQVTTYAELWSTGRSLRHPLAGVVMYVNEMHPSEADFKEFQHEVRMGSTDVLPEGTLLGEVLEWREGNPLPALPLAFRLRRAFRAVPVGQGDMRIAAREFAKVVDAIEQCLAREHFGEAVRAVWPQQPNPTCPACDVRFSCPAFPASGTVSGLPRAPLNRTVNRASQIR